MQVSKENLADLSRHLQKTKETIEFLKLEFQFQRIELQEKHDTFKSLNHLDDKSFIPTASSVKVVQVQLSSKPLIKPWEQIQSNKSRRSLGYVKDDTELYIPDYSKPIKFFSVGFLEQITSASFDKVADKQKCMQLEVAVKPTCSHCQRIGHMEDQCFDLHPCRHCGDRKSVV